MSFVYIAAASFELDSANSIQTYLTCRELAKVVPDLRVILPKSPRRPGRSQDVPVRWVNKVPLRWALGERGERIERRLFALRAAAIARQLGRPVYTREALVAARCAALGLPVTYEMHFLPGDGGSRLRRVEERAMDGASCLVVLNTALAERLQAEGCTARVEVVPDAFDGAVFHPRSRAESRRRLAIAPERFVIGYSGMTFAGRGVDLLLEAFGLLGVGECLLILIGGRAGELEALGAHGRADVVGAGRRSLSEVAEYLAAADVLVIPEVLNGIAASPLKLFEYSAMEVPIVAVDRPAIRAVLGDDAFYFRPGEAAALAVALRVVGDDPAAARERARCARRRLGELDYGHRARRIRALMQAGAR